MQLNPFPHIFAHRGGSQLAPENTLIAMRQAHQFGAQWVEFDVMLSKDGEAIIFHDKLLNRTTNGKGPVYQYNYTQLLELDAGSWFDPRYAQEHIPTFKAMLLLLKELKLFPNIELKPLLRRHEQPLVDKVLATIKEVWPGDWPFIISSFARRTLKMVRTVEPNLLIGFLMHEWSPRWYLAAKKLQCISVHVNEQILNAERVADIKRRGYYLFSYTVNSPAHAEELFTWGVDGIFTDCPDLFV